MADYYSVLLKAIEKLDDKSVKVRENIYKRARSALLQRLADNELELSKDAIAQHQTALEEAITLIEKENFTDTDPKLTASSPSRPLPSGSSTKSATTTKSKPVKNEQKVTNKTGANTTGANTGGKESEAKTISRQTVQKKPETRQSSDKTPVSNDATSPNSKTPRAKDDKSTSSQIYLTKPSGLTDSKRKGEPQKVSPKAATVTDKKTSPQRQDKSKRSAKRAKQDNNKGRSVKFALAMVIAVTALLVGWMVYRSGLTDYIANLMYATPQQQTETNEVDVNPESITDDVTPDEDKEPTEEKTDSGSDDSNSSNDDSSSSNDENSIESLLAKKDEDRAPTIDSDDDSNASDKPLDQGAILLEDAFGTNSYKNYFGSVTWSSEADANNQADEIINAEINIPERDLSITLTITNNNDPDFEATNLITVQFKNSKNFNANDIELTGVLIRENKDSRAEPITAAIIKVIDNMYWVALPSSNTDVARDNLNRLSSYNWLTLTLRYPNQQKATLSFQKGDEGSKVFKKVLAKWNSSRNDL